jgi:beta-propeller repeat-containing protein
MLKNKSTHFAITFMTMFTVQGALAANTTPTANPAIADYTRPISFEPNRGQTDKQVDFLARGAGYGLFLSRGKAVMAFKNGAVRMSPVRANASPRAEALNPQSSESNYFVGNVPGNWHTNIANYAKVRYRDVYPGVDLIYYGTQRQLEYDFVVAPGRDPNTIALQFDSGAKPVLERSGDLVMHTEAGELRWHKPVAYQEVNGRKQLVACVYVCKGRRLAFNLGAYDRTKPLVLDPVLLYSTYLGGSGLTSGDYDPYADFGTAIAVDAGGNAYITGQTSSSNFPVKSCFRCYHIGVGDVFVTKFDSVGRLVYSTYLGGSGGPGPWDWGQGIAVDATGNAYVTGYTQSAKFPVKNAFQSVLKGGINAFVTKLNTAGSALIYSTYLGGSVVDKGFGIAVDSYGNAYVTGATQSGNFPTKNAVQKQAARCGNFPYCQQNAFVTKFDVAGSALVYSTYLGGSGNVSTGTRDQGYGIAVDASGDAYVTGVTNSTDFPIKNALQAQNRSANGGSNAFVTKFEAAGTALVYSTYLGGSTHYNLGTSGDAGFAIAVDAGRNAYVTGYTDSIDFPIKYPFQRGLGTSDGNAFVTKFNSAGTALGYSTYLGGANGDRGNGIAVDTHGDAYVAGSTSGNFPIKNAFQGTFKGYRDAFIAKFNAFGTGLIYSSYLGGSGYLGDDGTAVAVDSTGNAYVTGFTNSIDFPIKNAFQSTLKSAKGNAFVTKISAQ